MESKEGKFPFEWENGDFGDDPERGECSFGDGALVEIVSTIGLSKDGDLTVISGFGSSLSGRVMCVTRVFFLEDPDPGPLSTGMNGAS